MDSDDFAGDRLCSGVQGSAPHGFVSAKRTDAACSPPVWSRSKDSLQNRIKTHFSVKSSVALDTWRKVSGTHWCFSSSLCGLSGIMWLAVQCCFILLSVELGCHELGRVEWLTQVGGAAPLHEPT